VRLWGSNTKKKKRFTRSEKTKIACARKQELRGSWSRDRPHSEQQKPSKTGKKPWYTAKKKAGGKIGTEKKRGSFHRTPISLLAQNTHVRKGSISRTGSKQTRTILITRSENGGGPLVCEADARITGGGGKCNVKRPEKNNRMVLRRPARFTDTECGKAQKRTEYKTPQVLDKRKAGERSAGKKREKGPSERREENSLCWLEPIDFRRSPVRRQKKKEGKDTLGRSMGMCTCKEKKGEEGKRALSARSLEKGKKRHPPFAHFELKTSAGCRRSQSCPTNKGEKKKKKGREKRDSNPRGKQPFFLMSGVVNKELCTGP